MSSREVSDPSPLPGCRLRRMEEADMKGTWVSFTAKDTAFIFKTSLRTEELCSL